MVSFGPWLGLALSPHPTINTHPPQHSEAVLLPVSRRLLISLQTPDWVLQKLHTFILLQQNKDEHGIEMF